MEEIKEMLRRHVRASFLPSAAEAGSIVGKMQDWGLYVLFSRVVEALISETSVEIFLYQEEGLSS